MILLGGYDVLQTNPPCRAPVFFYSALLCIVILWEHKDKKFADCILLVTFRYLFAPLGLLDLKMTRLAGQSMMKYIRVIRCFTASAATRAGAAR